MVPATIFFLAWYFGFIVLAGYAPDFMGEEVLIDGFTVGYVLALTQFLMVWVLGACTCARQTASSTRSPSAPPRLRSQAGAARDGSLSTRGHATEEVPEPMTFIAQQSTNSPWSSSRSLWA